MLLHGLSYSLGRTKEVVTVTEAEVGVEEIHLLTGQFVGEMCVLNRSLKEMFLDIVNHP